MFTKALLVSLIFSLTSRAFSFELKNIPGGQIEATWLSPKSQKKSKKTIIILKVKSFKMMSKAVTVQNFNEFIQTHSEWKKENVNSLFADNHYLEGFNIENANSPVTNISWFAARAYCESLGMRLPTVNEWEYSAAASEIKKDANRELKFLNRILEWYGEPQTDHIKNVGTIYKNKYGLWDMHGLIWEWVEDFNTTFVTGESREDSSFNKDMFCGAGALSSTDKENYASFMRFAFRSSLKGRSTIWNLGFRCAQSNEKGDR